MSTNPYRYEIVITNNETGEEVHRQSGTVTVRDDETPVRKAIEQYADTTDLVEWSGDADFDEQLTEDLDSLEFSVNEYDYEVRIL